MDDPLNSDANKNRHVLSPIPGLGCMGSLPSRCIPKLRPIMQVKSCFIQKIKLAIGLSEDRYGVALAQLNIRRCIFLSTGIFLNHLRAKPKDFRLIETVFVEHFNRSGS